MNRWQELVTAFHSKFGMPAPRPDEGWRKPRTSLRHDLIEEESDETKGALKRQEWDKVIDGLCDTIVVCVGTAVEMGVDLDPFMEEVMRTNMLKEGGAFAASGKLTKPPGWQPPRIAEMLKELP